MRKRIAVFGGASKFDSESQKLAEQIGRAIARTGLTLVNGATSGLPYFAGKAALAEGGFVLGISPATNALEHVEKYRRPLDGCSEIIWTGIGFTMRNAMNGRNCDAAIFVGGEIGTLQEFCVSYAEGKIIGVLTSSGGVSELIPEIVKSCTNRAKAPLFFQEEVEALVSQVVDALSSV